MDVAEVVPGLAQRKSVARECAVDARGTSGDAAVGTAVRVRFGDGDIAAQGRLVVVARGRLELSETRIVRPVVYAEAEDLQVACAMRSGVEISDMCEMFGTVVVERRIKRSSGRAIDPMTEATSGVVLGVGRSTVAVDSLFRVLL